MLSLSKDSAAYRLASTAATALTTDEAKAFYAELGQCSLAIASVVAHLFMLLLSWLVWLADGCVGWVAAEVDAALRPQAAALPWAAEVPTLARWSNTLEIQWPDATDWAISEALQ